MTTNLITPADLDRLQALCDAATPGPRQVDTVEHPHYRGGSHKERRIFTLHDHPQLKGPEPIVTSSTGISATQGGAPIWMVSISEANADFIAATDPDTVRALCALARRSTPSDSARSGEGAATKAEIHTLRRLIECAEELDKRPRPMCRDCADEDGTCPNSRLECDMGKLFADAKALHNRLATVPAPQAAASVKAWEQRLEEWEAGTWPPLPDLTTRAMSSEIADLRAALAATQASPAVAAEAEFVAAAKTFAQAHIDCDEMEARDDQGDDVVSDHEYETITAAYNSTKKALVQAYRALAAHPTAAALTHQAAAPKADAKNAARYRFLQDCWMTIEHPVEGPIATYVPPRDGEDYAADELDAAIDAAMAANQ